VSAAQGSITKTGNTHARRLLVEAAWHHRKNYDKPSVVLTKRWAQVSPLAKARGHAGNHRLHRRWATFTARGKRPVVANVARNAELERAMAVLNASSDPVVRIALVDAMAWHQVAQHQAILERLRSDLVPAIRLLASVAVFSSDDPGAWRVLDAAVRADLEPCAGVLNAPGSRRSLTAGERWARALTGLDREQDCYAWTERLTNRVERPQVRLEGVRMALVAMRDWRAAPGRVTPVYPPLRHTVVPVSVFVTVWSIAPGVQDGSGSGSPSAALRR
jgi:phosphopantetheinyl transferase (holo-ACP synthase)